MHIHLAYLFTHICTLNLFISALTHRLSNGSLILNIVSHVSVPVKAHQKKYPCISFFDLSYTFITF